MRKTFALVLLGFIFLSAAPLPLHALTTDEMLVLAGQAITSCKIEGVDAAGTTCVNNSGTAAFASCWSQGNGVQNLQTCVNQGLTAAANSLERCFPKSTEEQRSCFLTTVTASINAASGGNAGGNEGSANYASSDGFQSLTGLPLFENIEAGGDLSSFFNQLYILAVGAAAVLAVAQIMIAGFKWATAGGSHSAIEQSRDLLRNSVLGLLLVLSPTIVFGIINPDILSLRIGTGDLLKRGEVTVDPRASLTCTSFPNLGVLDRQPTAADTWSSDNRDAGTYQQCCSAYDAKFTDGAVCTETTTTVGGGIYCKCTTIAAGKWHMAFGGGLVVDFVKTVGRTEQSTRCELAAPDEENLFFDSETTCKAAYGSSAKINASIRTGQLLSADGDPACIKIIEETKKNSLSIATVRGPTCEQVKK